MTALPFTGSAQLAGPPLTHLDKAPLPTEDQVSPQRMSEFIREQYTNGLAARRPHAIGWIMTQSFLRGVHHFAIDHTGVWSPILPEEGKDRSVTPVLVPQYRHALGFFNSNSIGVSTVPVAGGTSPLYRSARAEDILNFWIRETDVPSVADRVYQLLLTEGTCGLYRFKDPFRQNVYVKALPGSELFPMPYDARDRSEIHGLIHATVVSKQWLQLQDMAYEQATGSPPPKRMADQAGTRMGTMRVDLPTVGSAGMKGRFDGALVLTAWMEPNEQAPYGEYFFIVNEELFRHATDQETLNQIMPKGRIPVEILYYDKNPNDFWGTSFCETIIPSQLASDRAATIIERNAKYNRSLTFYYPDRAGALDARREDTPWIPLKENPMSTYNQSRLPPVFHFPARTTGRDNGLVLDLAFQMADRAAGFRSNMIFGQAEGRTESGPAATILNQNATAALTPAMKRLDQGWENTYPEVLDMLHDVWPEKKTIRVAGAGRLGRELVILRNEIPWSDQVIIQPRPTLPGGRQTLAQILFDLRQMPGQDGVQGSAIPEREFRMGLAKLNLLPPGLEIFDKAEARIQTRINLLIGDGRNPAIQPSEPANPGDRLIMERHNLAVEMLRDVILDDSFMEYSPQVQSALLKQFEFHFQRLPNKMEQPGQFDDDLEKMDSAQMEEYLAIAEADLDSPEGEFTTELPANFPIGLSDAAAG